MTLRHSWYKAVSHHLTDPMTINLKLHHVRLKELKLSIQNKVEHALLLSEYLVPLQALLDTVLDNESSYLFNGKNFSYKEHNCQGQVHIQQLNTKSVMHHVCNKLCFLTPQAREEVLNIEG